jgi:hypothetical protein
MSKKKKAEAGPPGLVPGAKLHVVQRRSWRAGWEQFRRGDNDEGGAAVRAFVKRKHAEALRDELEREARRELCPFHFLIGELSEDAFGGVAGFRKGLKALHVPVPPAKVLKTELGDNSAWVEWWDGINGELTAEQREGVWALFKWEGFYEVVATELDTPDK